MPFVEESVVEYDEQTNQNYISTLEGPLWLTEGDWVIRGVKGEYYPCKPDIFALTYVPAEKTDSIESQQTTSAQAS